MSIKVNVSLILWVENISVLSRLQAKLFKQYNLENVSLVPYQIVVLCCNINPK